MGNTTAGVLKGPRNCSTSESFPLKNTSFLSYTIPLLNQGISVLLASFFCSLNIFVFTWSFVFKENASYKAGLIQHKPNMLCH